MHVLLLSPYPDRIQSTIRAAADSVIVANHALKPQEITDGRIDFIVSYGYKHILREPVLTLLPGRVINLHISYLPWNRGYYPNLWAWYDSTPNGVCIHRIDEGIDTGPVLVREQSAFRSRETLATSYTRLRAHVEELFATRWPEIRSDRLTSQPQEKGGSSHTKAEGEALIESLPEGFDTDVRIVQALGSRRREALRQTCI